MAVESAPARPIAPQTPAPPPALPSENTPVNEIATLILSGQVRIADAFVSPDFVPAPDADVIDDTQIKKLQSLTLDHHWRGGDDGLAALREFPNLVSLTLRNAPLTDRALDQIAKLPRLQSLDIDSVPISAKALTKFRTAKPKINLSARGKATLGVNVGGPRSCVLTGVVAGTGAAEAGLQPGDEILAVDGQKVLDFSDLAIAVYARQPGERVRVEYRRGNKHETAKVLLSERKLIEPVLLQTPR